MLKTEEGERIQKTAPIAYCLGSTHVLLAWQENGPQQLVMGLSDHSLHSEGSLSEALSFSTEIETLFDGVGVPGGSPGGSHGWITPRFLSMLCSSPLAPLGIVQSKEQLLPVRPSQNPGESLRIL